MMGKVHGNDGLGMLHQEVSEAFVKFGVKPTLCSMTLEMTWWNVSYYMDL